MRILLSILLAAFLLSGCSTAREKDDGCRSCHRGLEEASPTHDSCVSCHGGDGQVRDKQAAHAGMYGPANPSAPSFWEKSCGRCHTYQLGRVRSGLMYTNAGIIRGIKETWEGNTLQKSSVRGGKGFGPDGRSMELASIAAEEGLPAELYRKFCSLCHVGTESSQEGFSGHPSGCATCHFPYDESTSYGGGDATMRGKSPHSASHKLVNLPGNEVCMRCHNRSGRIALSYQGLLDGNSAMVPTRQGQPGPVMAGEGRNLTHIMADVHYTAGMDCIDCHTSRDIMGDGYLYDALHKQVEIACEDCHGGVGPPRTRKIVRENEEPVRESAAYRLPMTPGREMVLTAKERMYSNVFIADGNVLVLGKRSGRLFRSTVITGTSEHTIAGHGRLACHSCHSRTVVQCSGCHTTYDRRETAPDYVRNEETPGRFSETEDYRTLYPFPLALNQVGRIAPVTPGCQTFVTVIDEQGNLVKKEEVARYKGRRQLRFAPFYSHNTGKKAVTCSECHGNPAFLGFGQHVIEGGDIRGTLLCELSEEKPLDGFLSMEGGRVTAYSAITRQGSRPLNTVEIRRVFSVNLCLVCHRSAKDPIYLKELDYRALDDALHRRLLGGSNRGPRR